jgi:hypothetical protein
MNYSVLIVTRSAFIAFIAFILAILIGGVFGGYVDAQDNGAKLTQKESEDATAFARKFLSEMIEAKEITPLLKKYAVSEFDDCLVDYVKRYGFETLRDDQIRDGRLSKVKSYYLAETDFLLALMFSGLTGSEDDIFSTLPVDVQLSFTKKAFNAMAANDSNFDPDTVETDEEANAYFDMMLEAMERSAPLLRKHAKNNWGKNRQRILDLIKEFEKNASYAFKPELWIYEDGLCGMLPKNRRFIAIDIPFFQLKLTEIGGKYYIVEFPFHVD